MLVGTACHIYIMRRNKSKSSSGKNNKKKGRNNKPRQLLLLANNDESARSAIASFGDGDANNANVNYYANYRNFLASAGPGCHIARRWQDVDNFGFGWSL